MINRSATSTAQRPNRIRARPDLLQKDPERAQRLFHCALRGAGERAVILRKKSMRDILLAWTMMLTVICRMPMIGAGNEPYADELHFQSSEPLYCPGEVFTWEPPPSSS